MAGEDRYRLAPVRDARARDERVKRSDLAAAVGDARETQAKLDGALAQVAAARAALAKASAARDALVPGAAAQLARADQFIARRRRELEAAIGEELRAEAANNERLGHIDIARATLTRARAEREVIERHFERWREARKKLAERRED